MTEPWASKASLLGVSLGERVSYQTYQESMTSNPRTPTRLEELEAQIKMLFEELRIEREVREAAITALRDHLRLPI